MIPSKFQAAGRTAFSHVKDSVAKTVFQRHKWLGWVLGIGAVIVVLVGLRVWNQQARKKRIRGLLRSVNKNSARQQSREPLILVIVRKGIDVTTFAGNLWLTAKHPENVHFVSESGYARVKEWLQEEVPKDVFVQRVPRRVDFSKYDICLIIGGGRDLPDHWDVASCKALRECISDNGGGREVVLTAPAGGDFLVLGEGGASLHTREFHTDESLVVPVVWASLDCCLFMPRHVDWQVFYEYWFQPDAALTSALYAQGVKCYAVNKRILGDSFNLPPWLNSRGEYQSNVGELYDDTLKHFVPPLAAYTGVVDPNHEGDAVVKYGSARVFRKLVADVQQQQQ